jgi:hypothetical protein
MPSARSGAKSQEDKRQEIYPGRNMESMRYEGVSKSFRTESITKYTLTTTNTRWEATQRVMAAKLTRPTHKIAIQLHLVAKSCTICSSRSRRPVRKLLDTPLYVDCNVSCSWWCKTLQTTLIWFCFLHYLREGTQICSYWANSLSHVMCCLRSHWSTIIYLLHINIKRLKAGKCINTEWKHIFRSGVHVPYTCVLIYCW